MQAILDGNTFDLSNADGPEKESVEHLWTRYQDIEERFPAELKSDALPYFVDWLLERVVVVEIATADEEMALEIFETMNDRGLRLTTTDMLKSYLLSKIADKIKLLNIERGLTFCLIEHDLDYVSKLCDDVVVMAQGKLLTRGSVESVRQDERVIEAYFGGGKYEAQG